MYIEHVCALYVNYLLYSYTSNVSIFINSNTFFQLCFECLND